MRILIVEDEPKLARLLARGLAEEGHPADVAATGEDALWMAGAAAYDAIVLDVMLPGLDGFAVCRTLREREIWTPVLMLTARGEIEDRIEGLDTGADDYLLKPFAFDELLARLRALVRRAPRRASGRAGGGRPPARSGSAPGVARRDRARALDEGVRPARALPPPGGRGPLARAAAGRRLGHVVREPLERDRRLRALPPREDRPAVRPPGDRDGAWHRLPAARRRRLARSAADADQVDAAVRAGDGSRARGAR